MFQTGDRVRVVKPNPLHANPPRAVGVIGVVEIPAIPHPIGKYRVVYQVRPDGKREKYNYISYFDAEQLQKL